MIDLFYLILNEFTDLTQMSPEHPHTWYMVDDARVAFVSVDTSVDSLIRPVEVVGELPLVLRIRDPSGEIRTVPKKHEFPNIERYFETRRAAERYVASRLRRRLLTLRAEISGISQILDQLAGRR